jgi:hypothetical protein
MAPMLTPTIHVHHSCKIFLSDKESQNIYNATLTVNATKDVNNTDVYCVSEDHLGASNHSLNAILMITKGNFLQCNNNLLQTKKGL